MNRVLAIIIVAATACSSQSQNAPGPGPGEAPTVPTAPEPRVEVTPPESAAASFPKAKKEGQKRSEELVEKGREVLKTKGRVAAPEAGALFAEAVKEDARNTMAYWELGWAQQIGGDFDAALATWQTLKQLDPKFPDLDNFSAIATTRKSEPAIQAHTAGTGDDPPLAATPVKKKAKKAEAKTQPQ
ncbi:MAG: tetratricopeptide repeat protein [Myxococcota bacterium]|nr:hypothetical protein [Myxococcota bacterium]